MIRVLLINQDKIPHYRVAVFNYLSEYLKENGFNLTVVSGGTEDGNPYPIEFDYRKVPLNFHNLLKLIVRLSPEVIIFWVRLRYLYLFPTLIITKILKIRSIYWGHGPDLLDRKSKVKKVGNVLQYWMSDALILYGEHLRENISTKFHYKVFVANNTLNITSDHVLTHGRDSILRKYNIRTRKNIVCMGRIEKRKRLEDLIEAFKLLDRREYGLILVGPDRDGILEGIEGHNIYKLGPIYGEEGLALLSAADVYCLPGHVGLSIVDAFYCGLPVVTEKVDHAPEIMYLKDGVNGFIVPKGDIEQLSAKLELLLENEALRKQFSREARGEITTNGHIDRMCKGFREALRFVCNVH